MVRGWLDENTLGSLAKGLPRLSEAADSIIGLAPDFISGAYPPRSTVPHAAPCYADAVHAFRAAVYALHESQAEYIWYASKRNPPDPLAAVYFAVFFADDCVLRLYASAGHLAAALVAMLEIPRKSLERTRTLSLQTKVGKWLAANQATLPLTTAIVGLGKSEDWSRTMKYRNCWVHSGPTRIAGFGIAYGRQARWHQDPADGSWAMGLGAGDPTEMTLQELTGLLRRSLSEFATVLSSAIEAYFVELALRGIAVGGGHTTFTLGKI